MDANCGTSATFTQLAKHVNNVPLNSLITRRQEPQYNQFRQKRANDLANLEFAKFSNNITVEDHYGFVVQNNGAANTRREWVQQFGDLSLNTSSGTNMQWQSERNSGTTKYQHYLDRDDLKSQNHLNRDFLLSQTPRYTAEFRQRLALHFQPIMNMRTDLARPLYPAEHHELHESEIEAWNFKQQFDLVESELQNTVSETALELDKVQFAEAARKVHETLTTDRPKEMTEKLEQSSFLRLISSISQRKVEISGNDLINVEDGKPIQREDGLHNSKVSLGNQDAHNSLTLESMQEHSEFISTHGSIHIIDNSTQQGPPKNTQSLHLPDPMGHIHDGALNPLLLLLQAAQVISGNQVAASDWMEDDLSLDMSDQVHNIMQQRWQDAYDDYINDDDKR